MATNAIAKHAKNITAMPFIYRKRWPRIVLFWLWYTIWLIWFSFSRLEASCRFSRYSSTSMIAVCYTISKEHTWRETAYRECSSWQHLSMSWMKRRMFQTRKLPITFLIFAAFLTCVDQWLVQNAKTLAEVTKRDLCRGSKFSCSINIKANISETKARINQHSATFKFCLQRRRQSHRIFRSTRIPNVPR